MLTKTELLSAISALGYPDNVTTPLQDIVIDALGDVLDAFAALAPMDAITDAPSDAATDLSVLNILDVHTQINASNTKQNAIAGKLNALLAGGRTQNLIEES